MLPGRNKGLAKELDSELQAHYASLHLDDIRCRGLPRVLDGLPSAAAMQF